MFLTILANDVFAFIKPSLDAHTLGINSAAELLRECGYSVLIGDDDISRAMNNIRYESNRKLIVDWIKANNITVIGVSYRLDPSDAVNIMGYLMNELKNNNMLFFQGGPIKLVIFGGLPKACEIIDKEHKGFIITFQGGESSQETLLRMGVPLEKIPEDIVEGCSYDNKRLEFGKEIIKEQKYKEFLPVNRCNYAEYGTKNDTIIKRLDNNMSKCFLPLTRAHVGPYSSDLSPKEAVFEFIEWVKILAKENYLDVLSIGTSQLTQSNFGESWEGLSNGGGVPVNSPEEYRMIWENSRPMLVRTYAGTKNIPELAKIHEETLNISWHALSFWWFNKLDQRGPYDLLTNLRQHVETLKYIASTNKPFEPNVPHHFAFRGTDDVTYIVSAYLSAKLAKKMGIKTLILQNMLNTPRITWGIQDLAKSRAMLKLVKSLEDKNFRVVLQPRAGLDYFSSDLNVAKIQLSAVTALMDDIDPHNESSPPIIHVVSYSEASHLATPDIVNESIKITQYSLQMYRELRRKGYIDDMSYNYDVNERMNELLEKAKKIINAIETSVKNPYSPEGFYTIFASGFLPVPYLWGDIEEFTHATKWKSKPVKGSVKLADEKNNLITTEELIDYAKSNIDKVEASISKL